jgi:hypothetical protein
MQNCGVYFGSIGSKWRERLSTVKTLDFEIGRNIHKCVYHVAAADMKDEYMIHSRGQRDLHYWQIFGVESHLTPGNVN